MKNLLFALILSVIFPAVTLAQEPAPTPDTPYRFEPIDIPEAPHDIPINFINVDFVNDMGSYALTLFALLDAYNVLGIFVVILVSTSALWWLYSFVTGKPLTSDTLNISEALKIGSDQGYIDKDSAGLSRTVIKESRKIRF